MTFGAMLRIFASLYSFVFVVSVSLVLFLRSIFRFALRANSSELNGFKNFAFFRDQGGMENKIAVTIPFGCLLPKWEVW